MIVLAKRKTNTVVGAPNKASRHLALLSVNLLVNAGSVQPNVTPDDGNAMSTIRIIAERVD